MNIREKVLVQLKTQKNATERHLIENIYWGEVNY